MVWESAEVSFRTHGLPDAAVKPRRGGPAADVLNKSCGKADRRVSCAAELGPDSLHDLCCVSARMSSEIENTVEMSDTGLAGGSSGPQ